MGKLVWGKSCFKLLGLNFHVDLDKMNDLNYKEKISKIENIIKIWKRRYLTPLGKITVIKSLLVSRLNHLFISLPNPNENIILSLNNMFFNFLWEGPAKIKSTIIVKQYSEGGLKMINLRAFIHSLKLTWIRRVLKSNSPWKLLFDNTIDINKLLHFGSKYCDSTIINIIKLFLERCFTIL